VGLYTFFVEKNGATSIEQFPGADIEEAAALWHQRSQYVPGLVDPADPDPTPVAETRNVRCLSGIDGADDFYLVHVVGPLTEEAPVAPDLATQPAGKSSTEVGTRDLRRVFNLLMEHMEAIGQEAIDLPGDFYWDVPAEALYDPYSEPRQLDLGQLSEDWEKLLSLANGESPPVGYAFVWLASILRAYGQSARR
jgi:hypothetical protein